VHETIQQVLRDRMQDDAVAVRYAGRTWTWREHLAEAAAEASAMIRQADPARPLHVGVLLGNTPAMLRSMAAAALGGYVLCGINTTRRGDGLLADIRRSDCQLLLIDPDHRPLLDGLRPGDLLVIDRSGEDRHADEGQRRNRARRRAGRIAPGKAHQIARHARTMLRRMPQPGPHEQDQRS